MSQIDKIVYLPLLFWFILLYFMLYLLVYSYFIITTFTSIQVRLRLFNVLKNNLKVNILNYFLINILIILDKLLIFNNLSKIIKN